MADESYLEILKSMSRNDGLKQWLIMNREGVILQSNGIEGDDATRMAAVVSRLADKMDQFSQHVINEENEPSEIKTVRLRTLHDEIIICPHPEYLLVAIQEPGYVEPEKDEEESDSDL